MYFRLESVYDLDVNNSYNAFGFISTPDDPMILEFDKKQVFFKKQQEES